MTYDDFHPVSAEILTGTRAGLEDQAHFDRFIEKVRALRSVLEIEKAPPIEALAMFEVLLVDAVFKTDLLRAAMLLHMSENLTEALRRAIERGLNDNIFGMQQCIKSPTGEAIVSSVPRTDKLN